MDPSNLTAQQTAVNNVPDYTQVQGGYVDMYPGEAITTFDVTLINLNESTFG